MNRRTFLKFIGTIPFINIANANQLNKNKSVIQIFLGGGASQIETFNPVPNAPSEIRSTTGYISCSNGIQLGGTFENLSKLSDKFSVVHSFGHGNAGHSGGTHWCMTGHNNPDEGSPQKEPSFGSIISKSFQTTGIPNYVRASKTQYDESAWLGIGNNPYNNDKESIDNLVNRIELSRFKDRTSLVEHLDKMKSFGNMSTWANLRNQSHNLLLSNVDEAFRIEKEENSPYFGSDLGKHLLLARRLVERGTKYVSVHYGGWDMHGSIKSGFESRGTELDKYLSLLISDLWDKGLNKDTLVLVFGEFGRTVKINATAGRDHWPQCSPLLISGMDLPPVIGKSDKNAAYPDSRPIGPMDILATIFDHFGLDNKVQYVDNSGRPRYLVDGESLAGVVGGG